MRPEKVSADRRIDFAGRSWSGVAQDHHLELAGNPNFPDYLRVAFVAYGRHAANGHAVLERGELAAYLVRRKGELPDRRQVWAAMKKAVRLGYLHPDSRIQCLVVDPAAVQGGRGDPDARCNRRHAIRSESVDARQNVGRDDGRLIQNVGRDAGRFIHNVRDDDGRFRRGPSSLSSSAPTDRAADAANPKDLTERKPA